MICCSLSPCLDWWQYSIRVPGWVIAHAWMCKICQIFREQFSSDRGNPWGGCQVLKTSSDHRNRKQNLQTFRLKSLSKRFEMALYQAFPRYFMPMFMILTRIKCESLYMKPGSGPQSISGIILSCLASIPHTGILQILISPLFKGYTI